MALKPPVEVPQGAIRLNTDSQKLEFFAQDQWWQMATDVPTLQGGARGVFAGGYTGGPATLYNNIEYITIPSAGNAIDFGNLTDARDYTAAGSSPTRTCFAGGRDPSNTNIIDYITTASTGNANDFGDLITAEMRGVIMSNSSRGVIGSDGSITNALDYITFATTGNSLDFGDQVSSSAAPVVYSFGGCSDSHGGIS